MRWTMAAAAVVIGTMGAEAAENTAAAEPVVVRVFDSARVGSRVLAGARAIASEIYERAGFRIEWSAGDARSLKSIEHATAHFAGPGCPSVTAIDVKIGFIPPQQKPGVLGYALPFFADGVRVIIGIDRVYAHSGLTGVPAHVILGLVLAHEIGHVLKGTDGHEDRGLMRAQLRGEKTLEADGSLPEFHPDELRLMRANVELTAAPKASCGALLAGRS